MRHGGEGTLIERAIFLGAKERVPARLVAVRMPESIVNARRGSAKKKAKKKGDRPAKAPRTLLAWPLFLRKVPCTMWQIATVGKG
jgi:hypothetical protein